jgi:hypothetical protein
LACTGFLVSSAIAQPVAVEVPAVRPAPAVDGADKDLTPMQQALMQQYRPVLKSELSFATRICHLDKKHRQELFDVAEEAVKKLVKDAPEAQLRGARFAVMIQNGRVVQSQSGPDAQKAVRDAIAKAVKDKLPGETADRYAGEMKKRVEFDQHSAILSVVARLDKQLLLSAEQREAITKSLTTGWNEKWAPRPETFMFGGDFMPSVPDNLLVPHLREGQIAVLKSDRAGGTITRMVVNGINFGAPGLNDIWDDDADQ